MRFIVISIVALLGLIAGARAEDAVSTLEKVRRTGSLTIGYQVGAPPFSFVNAINQPVGYSIDLCIAIAETVKEQLGRPDLSVQLVPLTAEQRIQAVVAGTIDIECGSSTQTLSRREKVDFTVPIFIDAACMLIGVSSKVRKVEDLEGAKVAVIPGTTTEGVVKERLAKAGIHANVVLVPDHADGVAAVESGAVDAYVSDRSILVAAARNAKDPAKLLLDDHPLSYEPYGLVVRRNDAEFRLLADRTLARLYRTGEITPLFAKWFGAMGAVPSNLLTAMYILSSIPE